LDVAEYCREIETYLCRKNDGHLIRVVGPSFEIVSRWAIDGVPLKVALGGIDRYFERYYRKGPRRRPVRIDFCDADVRDVFDEWRRATGVSADSAETSAVARGKVSLPEHLERVLTKLSSLRATGALDAGMDAMVDHVARELDVARARAGGLRGAERKALLDRLEQADQTFMDRALDGLDHATREDLEREVAGELAAFQPRMSAEALERAQRIALGRLVRARLGLPTIAFH